MVLWAIRKHGEFAAGSDQWSVVSGQRLFLSVMMKKIREQIRIYPLIIQKL
jgi:hypothetical protein